MQPLSATSDSNKNASLPRLEQLLQQGQIWQAGDHQNRATERQKNLSSGYPLLDQQLVGEGWQKGNLVELLYDKDGSGELRLLLPTLAELSKQPRWILWVDPPHIPYAPALQAAGIDTDKILMVHSQSHQDRIWTLEQALKSGACSAVLGWPGEVADKAIRRLQVAASDSGAMGFIFRPQHCRQQSSSAPYRVALHPARGGVDVTLLKRKNGWAMPTLQLPLGEDQLLHLHKLQHRDQRTEQPNQPGSHLRLVR